MERFENFVKELEILSAKYGVTLSVTGGVGIWDEGDIQKVEYTKDHTSGDLSITKVNGMEYSRFLRGI